MPADIPSIAWQTFIQGSQFLLQVVPIFILAVFAAQLFVELRWLGGFSWIVRPLMRLGRLSPECGASFLVTVVSPTAGHSMLADYRLEGRLGRLELIIAAVVNNLPGEIAAGRTILPVALPALGLFGLAYYLMLLIAAALKAALMLALGRAVLQAPQDAEPSLSEQTGRPAFKDCMRSAWRASFRIILKVLMTMVPTAFAAAALIACGAFDRLGAKLGLLAQYFPITGATLPVVAARLVSPVGAYTIAGSLLASHAAGGHELVFAMVVGALISTGTNLRYLIPYYCGIFGLRTGAEIIGVSVLARIVSFSVVLTGMALLWR